MAGLQQEVRGICQEGQRKREGKQPEEERKREKQGSKRSVGRSHGKSEDGEREGGQHRAIGKQERCTNSEPWQDARVEQETPCTQIRQIFQ